MGKFAVIVVAAGKGRRMGTSESKQFLPIAGKPILVYTLEVFETMEEADTVVLVVGSEDMTRCEQYIRRYGLRKVRKIVAGGAERQESVYLGLQALAASVEWVLVHDGVRPLAEKGAISRCFQKAQNVGAAVLAVPVKDTIKRVDDAGRIAATPERKSLWSMQTPQAFRRSLLLEAHERARADGFFGTDDAMLVERLGYSVHVVEGDYANIKITTQDDLLWAQFLLQKRKEVEEK